MVQAVASAPSAGDYNVFATNLIRQRAIKMVQNIYSNTVNPANQNVINIQPQPVGLVLGWIVEVTSTLADPGAGNSYALTTQGPANLLSQISYNDLSNVSRILTTGWHLHAINTSKGGAPYLAARTNINYPVAYGDVFGGNLTANQSQNIIQAASIYDHTHFAQGLQMVYWVPSAYSMDDLRGSYYGNVVNANCQLQLTVNPAGFVSNVSDPNSAIYQAIGASVGGALGTAVTINVYQVYYDQLPVDPKSKQVILPYLSMSVIYDIKNATYPGITLNQDFPISYANFRDFLSTTVILDNPAAGVMPVQGSDVNYWALRQANALNIFKYPAKYTGIFSRGIIGDDYPQGMYFFDSRFKPISTVAFGNMQLIANLSAVNANAQALVGFEAFSYQNTIAAASSLSSGT